MAAARERVDTYYGNGRLFEEAAQLLAEAYKANPKDANVYVQAARITVMGGHVGFGNFEAGTFERYAALLDKALGLDPGNAKAHILKAEVFNRQGKPSEELRELEQAKASGTTDPWLKIGYGRYYRSIGDPTSSHYAYREVMDRGPGTTPSERKAYVQALAKLSTFKEPGLTREDRLRKYAALALKARYPTDAWTPQSYAASFIDYKMFDDAIPYAREALKTMDFGAGRRTLAAALYAKAAELRMAGRPASELNPLISEARELGVSKEAILEYLIMRRGVDDNLRALEPALREVIPAENSRAGTSRPS